MTRARGIPMAECKGCSLPIRFVKLNTGSAIPVNPAESTIGNVAAYKVGNQLHGHVISKDNPWKPGMLRFTPHHATCEAIDRPEPKPVPEPHPALFDVQP